MIANVKFVVVSDEPKGLMLSESKELFAAQVANFVEYDILANVSQDCCSEVVCVLWDLCHI